MGGALPGQAIGFQEEGREAARRGDPLHRTGCMLYWAEGAKSRNMIKFVNSDANMISVFRRFLIESLEVDAERICFSINVYTNNGLGIAEIEDHWLGILDLPRACARKHTLNHMPTSSSGRARNKLRYGVCTLVVHNTETGAAHPRRYPGVRGLRRARLGRLNGSPGTRTQNQRINLPHRLSPASRWARALRSGPSLHPRLDVRVGGVWPLRALRAGSRRGLPADCPILRIVTALGTSGSKGVPANSRRPTSGFPTGAPFKVRCSTS